MKSIRKYGGILIWVLIASILILWSINYITEKKIKSFLDSKVDEGVIRYESFTFSILTNNASIQSPILLLQDGSNTKTIKASRLSISSFSPYQYLIHSTIHINKIDLINPEVKISPNHSSSTPSSTSSEKQKISHNILIDQLNLKDGTIQYFKKDTAQTTLFCKIPEIRIEKLQLDTTAAPHPMSFSYDNLSITGDSLYYRVGKMYEMQVANFSSENDKIVIDTLQIKSRYSKREFESYIPYEKSQIELKIPRVTLDKNQFQLLNDTLLVAASKLCLNSANLNLYRNKTLPDNKKYAPMYSKLFRELPFRIDIDTISLIDAAITYELKVKSDRSPGLVFVNALNGSILNLTNVGMYQPDFPTTRISADAVLMKESPIHLDWSFDIDNRLDEFNVSGKISQITQKGLNYFIAPILNASIEGAIDDFAFNFAGNGVRAKGDAYIKYDTLRINMLKAKGNGKKPIISALMNLFIRNKLNGSTEVDNIKVKRDQTKSFWSYLWEMVKKGTLKSIT